MKGIIEMMFLIDMSASMCDFTDDTIYRFNSLIEGQKNLNRETLVTSILFNTKTKILHDRVRIEEIAPMTRLDYYPVGGTALRDAVGETVDRIELVHNRLKKKDVPKRTVLYIMTDGADNSSSKYDYKTIQKMLDRAKNEKGWNVYIIASEIEAECCRQSIGIGGECSFDWIHCPNTNTKRYGQSIGIDEEHRNDCRFEWECIEATPVYPDSIMTVRQEDYKEGDTAVATDRSASGIWMLGLGDEVTRREYRKFLESQGRTRNTIANYVSSINNVVRWESTDWEGVYRNIDLLLLSYGRDGDKEDLGKKKHSSIFHAIKKVKEHRDFLRELPNLISDLII